MNTASLRFTLIGTGVLGLIAAVRLAAWPLIQVTLPPAPAAVTPKPADAPPTMMAESAAAVASRDPFRIGRRPVFPPYDPSRLAEQLAPPPPRPVLLLVGVTEGAQPSAIIEGFPGVEGSRVVRVGDVIAGLAVKKVAAGRVVIVGMDTTWVLEVREPWKN